MEPVTRETGGLCVSACEGASSGGRVSHQRRQTALDGVWPSQDPGGSQAPGPWSPGVTDKGAACLTSGLTIPPALGGRCPLTFPSFLPPSLPRLPPSTKSGLCVHREPDSALGNLRGGCSGKAHDFPVNVRNEKQAWKSTSCQVPVTAPPSDTLCFPPHPHTPDRELPPSSRTVPYAPSQEDSGHGVSQTSGGKLQLPSWRPWC